MKFNMKKVFMVFVAVFALMSISFAAEAGDIVIYNVTGFDIYQIYISDSGANKWGENVLGSDVLENERMLWVTVHDSYSTFDMTAVDLYGTQVNWNVLPSDVSQIIIHGDETAKY